MVCPFNIKFICGELESIILYKLSFWVEQKETCIKFRHKNGPLGKNIQGRRNTKYDKWFLGALSQKNIKGKADTFHRNTFSYLIDLFIHVQGRIVQKICFFFTTYGPNFSVGWRFNKIFRQGGIPPSPPPVHTYGLIGFLFFICLNSLFRNILLL